MKKTNVIAQAASAAVLLFVAAGTVSAATTFNWAYVGNGATLVNSWNANTTGLINTTLHIANATAWANTAGSAVPASNAAFDTANNTSTKFQGQQLTNYGNELAVSTVNYGNNSPLALENSPQHAMDNSGPEEMILFTFDKAVQLNQLSLGYPTSGNCTFNSSACGTDMTVLAALGNPSSLNPASFDSSTTAGVGLGDTNKFAKFTFTATPNGSTPTGGVATGCKDAGLTGISCFNTGANGVSSKFWLVGAYNKYLGGGLTGDNDFVKIATLGGMVPSSGGGSGVPEPSSLALVGLGLIGGMRRWKAKKV